MLLKYSGNTTNMNMHMRRRHPSEFASSSLTMTSAAALSAARPAPHLFRSKYTPNSTQARLITDSVAQFMASDMQPYSVVDGAAFRKLLLVMEPRYVLPTRNHFANVVIPDLYALTRDRVIKGLTAANYVALTTDGWTSRSTESFITVTAHYIDAEWELKSPVLQTRPLHSSHTSSNLAEVLVDAVHEWNLGRPDDITISTDNAANIVKAVGEAGFHQHVPCFAHTVNLSVQRGIAVRDMSRLLGRIRAVVSFFHRSTTASALLKVKQTLLQLPNHKLIQDVSTRWNSSFDMVERYLEQQAAVYATLSTAGIRKNAKELITLNDTDVRNAEEICKILKPLKTITTVLCSGKSPTTSLILPLKDKIMKVTFPSEADSGLVESVKRAIADDMAARYEGDIVRFLHNSTAIDPRFKSLMHLDRQERALTYSTLENVIHRESETELRRQAEASRKKVLIV